MTDAPDASLVQLVETWHRACADFVALTREIPRDQWDLPTDLEGWTVKDVVAHTAHLEAVLAGAPEETIEVAEAPHLKGLMNYYTEQGVLARRDRDMPGSPTRSSSPSPPATRSSRPTLRPTGPPSHRRHRATSAGTCTGC